MGIGKKGNFPDLVANGENPNGTRVEYPGGISHGGIGRDFYQQWEYGPNDAGPRWGGAENPVMLGTDSEGSSLKGDKLKGGR